MSGDAFDLTQSPAANVPANGYSFGVGQAITATTAGAATALLNDNLTGFDYAITNLSTVEVFVIFGTATAVCTDGDGASPGIPVLPRTRLIVGRPDSATHIFTITATNPGGSARIVLTPVRSKP